MCCSELFVSRGESQGSLKDTVCPFETWGFPQKSRETTIYKAMFRCITHPDPRRGSHSANVAFSRGSSFEAEFSRYVLPGLLCARGLRLRPERLNHLVIKRRTHTSREGRKCTTRVFLKYKSLYTQCTNCSLELTTPALDLVPQTHPCKINKKRLIRNSLWTGPSLGVDSCFAAKPRDGARCPLLLTELFSASRRKYRNHKYSAEQASWQSFLFVFLIQLALRYLGITKILGYSRG